MISSRDILPVVVRVAMEVRIAALRFVRSMGPLISRGFGPADNVVPARRFVPSCVPWGPDKLLFGVVNNISRGPQPRARFPVALAKIYP